MKTNYDFEMNLDGVTSFSGAEARFKELQQSPDDIEYQSGGYINKEYLQELVKIEKVGP